MGKVIYGKFCKHYFSISSYVAKMYQFEGFIYGIIASRNWNVLLYEKQNRFFTHRKQKHGKSKMYLYQFVDIIFDVQNKMAIGMEPPKSVQVNDTSLKHSQAIRYGLFIVKV